jgi:hypothetical protein
VTTFNAADVHRMDADLLRSGRLREAHCNPKFSKSLSEPLLFALGRSNDATPLADVGPPV